MRCEIYTIHFSFHRFFSLPWFDLILNVQFTALVLRTAFGCVCVCMYVCVHKQT